MSAANARCGALAPWTPGGFPPGAASNAPGKSTSKGAYDCRFVAQSLVFCFSSEKQKTL
jgi:hypothetical protein